MSHSHNTLHPTTYTALCIFIERTINAALQHDPATQQKLMRHAGRNVSLELQEPNIALTLTFTDGSQNQPVVLASPFATSTADCALQGKTRGLFDLMQGPKKSLAGSDLRISGHTGFLMELVDIGQQLDIDWEDMLCRIIAKVAGPQWGDTAGHALAELLRNKRQHLQRIASRAPHFLGELLTEELRATPSHPEVNRFKDSVDNLQDDVERAAARLLQLKQKLQQKTPPSNATSPAPNPL